MEIGLILMASGRGRRFGGNKLLHPIDGVPMAKRAIDAVPEDVFSRAVIVARCGEVAALAEGTCVVPVNNPDTSDDTAVTIRLGLEAMPAGAAGCMFAVCDQPYLTAESVRRLAEDFIRHPRSICALAWNGKRGNPVIFPAALFGELASLPENGTGRLVIARHPDALRLVEASSERELTDIDEPV